MVKTKFFYILTFILVLVLLGCATQQVSVIEGFNYDQSKNRTVYFVVPYGKVSIPGKWVKTKYNSVSGQQFFRNSDSISVAVAFNRFDKYEFNQAGSKRGYEFVNAFYEWDSQYFVDSHGLNRRIIEADSSNNCIIYQIYGLTNGIEINSYFLIGEKNGSVSNFSVSTTDKWTEEHKVEFLKGLFFSDQ